MKSFLFLLIFSAMSFGFLQAQDTAFVEIKKLLSSDSQDEDGFGNAVAISGEYAIIGAYEEDEAGENAGAAYIYSRNYNGSNNWGEVRKLIPSDTSSAEVAFGYSVAISGDYAAVGAYKDTTNGSGAGAVYIFYRNEGGNDNWGVVKKLIASDTEASDNFGISVSLSGDYLFVGAKGDDDGGSSAGAAYIFYRNEGGDNNWGEVKKLFASDAEASDYFGEAISLSGDYAVVGAYRNDDSGSSSGSAYIFYKNAGGDDNWGEVKKLVASDAEGYDYFGQSISIFGDYVLVGAKGEDEAGDKAGAAYIFYKNAGGDDNWGEIKKLMATDAEEDDYFSHSLSIYGDYAIVGAYAEDEAGSSSGAAYLFFKNAGGDNNWGEIRKMTASDKEEDDRFAVSVSISDNFAVIGAYKEDEGGVNAGASYLFEKMYSPLPITSFPYVIDFEDEIMPPSGWQNPGDFWNIGTESYEGEYCARISYNYNGVGLLVSPVFSLSENLAISFWWKDDDISTSSPYENINSEEKAEYIRKLSESEGIEIAGHDTTFFEISTDMGLTWIGLDTLAEEDVMESYEQVFADLSEYANQNVMFRWRDVTDATSSAYGTGVDFIELFLNVAAPPNCAVAPSPADSSNGAEVTNLELSWTNGGGFPNGYYVYFGNANPPVNLIEETSETSVIINEVLEYSTTYYWQVIPFNEHGPAVNCPVWQFTTMEDPTIIPPYTQNFEGTFPPANWNKFEGLLSENSVLTPNNFTWYSDDYANIVDTIFGKAAKLNIWGTSTYDWLITAPIQLNSEKEYMLKFDLALTEYADTVGGTLGEDDLFAVVISTDNGLTWSSNNVLHYFDSETPIPNGNGMEVMISLSGYSGIVKIAFYGESTISNADNDLFVDNVKITEVTGASSVISVNEDWNMLSVPLTNSDMSVDSLFPTVISEVYEYANGYSSVTDLSNGVGYWAKFDSSEVFEIQGVIPSDNIPLSSGWNLIGPYSFSILTEEIVTIPEGILETVFFGFSNGYQLADELMPGKGYWVKASQEGEIVVNSVATKRNNSVYNIINTEWSKLKVTDAKGKSQTLYLAKDKNSNYELPPLPPNGVFDIRFDDNTFASDKRNSVVNIRGAVYPIKVSISGKDVKLSSSVNGINLILKDGEEITVSEKSINSFNISSLEIPLEFSLSQNYPNPFNPTTVINFALPETEQVSLKIYNLLGEQITELVNEMRDAGNYEVQFDASDLSSGVYFYSLQAGAFTSVKKMMLVR